MFMSNMKKQNIKSTLIIATYNWTEALELVLLSVLKQTTLPTEVIIADDGSRDDTKELIHKFKAQFKIPLIHVWHKDNGFRLAGIRNKAINQANGNYIIQIDGDIILHKDFIKDHVTNAKKGVFLVGSRVLLGEKISSKALKKKQLTFNFLHSNIKNRQYTLRLPLLSKLLKYPTSDINKVIRSVRGCNMSFWKSDLLKINGYNESMVGWGREDSEISARLINIGLEKHKLKFLGIQYHIHHLESSREGINLNDTILQNTVDNNITYTKNGISKEETTTNRTKVTAIIPTFNEEDNIEDVIKNVLFADEVIIIDSYSTDNTLALAKKYEVTIILRKFDNFSTQKNYAIDKAKNDWILILDADERLSKPAINEIIRILNNDENKVDAFWMNRQNYFLNRKIKYSGWQNDKVIKLFNRKKAKYNGRFVHEEITCVGNVSYLKNKLLHYTYNNDKDYKDKMALYSKLKAQELFEEKMKPNLYHFYIKPAYRFIYHYILKLGFLDGKNGWIIASINAYGIKKRYQILKKMYKDINQC